jgi:hypothetical protein
MAAIPGAPAGQNAIKLTTTAKTVIISPLFFFMKPGGGAGGTMSKARVRVAPNKTGDVMVAVSGQFAGGVGNQWQAAVYMASFLSSLTLGRLMTDFEFSVHCGGMIDGPSAGGLMAAGMLAAMTGANVRAEATMTGIVNPDGTIGPVGGIPQKFRAAAAKGKKVLGYPMGQRMNLDLATKRNADLHNVAQAAGAQAVEVRDVYDAYKLLTGKTIPRPTPLPAEKMALPATVNAALKKFARQWLAHTQRALQAYARTGARDAALLNFVRIAQGKAASAKALIAGGHAPAGYQRALESAVFSTIASYGGAFMASLARKNIAGILQELNKLAKSTATMDALAAKLAKLQPKNINDFMGLLFAYGYTIEAIATSVYGTEKYNFAKKLLAQIRAKGGQASPAELSRLVKALFAPTIYLSACFIMANAGTQMLQISAAGGGKALAIDNVRLGRIAKMFSSAAMSNLNYFDTIVVDPLAKRFNKRKEVARQIVMDKDFMYMLATLGLRLGSVIEQKWGSTTHGKMGLLAASLASYLNTSMLVSKAYSLGVQEKGGHPVAVRAVKAFRYMLTAAERRARENASSALAATGAVPVGAKVSYLIARAYVTSRSLEHQLEALSLYWTSSSVSQLAVMLYSK